jgi:hypothetical protein
MNKCDAISDNMTAYKNLYYYLEGTFDGEVLHVCRASNEEADNLANIGSQCLPIPQGVFWEEIIERSIKSTKVSTTGEQVQHQATGSGAGSSGTAEPEEVMMIEKTWMQPYLAYMVNKTLPEDTVQAKKDNTMIQGFCRVARKIIQEKHNRCVAMVRYSSRRTRNFKRHPRRGMWTSRQQQSHCNQSFSCRILLAHSH